VSRYAASLCESLVFDVHNADAVRRNKLKVLEAVRVFVDHENTDALAEGTRGRGARSHA
jgi:hypothetical protein